MRALTIFKYGKYPKITEAQIPKLTDPNLHLIKMNFAPLNPSDLNFYIGSYGVKKELPVAMGF